jgi:hypothetical protein
MMLQCSRWGKSLRNDDDRGDGSDGGAILTGEVALTQQPEWREARCASSGRRC